MVNLLHSHYFEQIGLDFGEKYNYSIFVMEKSKFKSSPYYSLLLPHNRYEGMDQEPQILKANITGI